MAIQDTNTAEALALAALGWVVGDGPRAQRLLDTTGLTPEQLRSGVGDPAVLAAILRFLEAHEPDLIACADDIGATPSQLVAARQSLETDR
jgi:hypothetical protein